MVIQMTSKPQPARHAMRMALPQDPFSPVCGFGRQVRAIGDNRALAGKYFHYLTFFRHGNMESRLRLDPALAAGPGPFHRHRGGGPGPAPDAAALGAAPAARLAPLPAPCAGADPAA